jgi:hypothetical protein
VYVLKLQRKIEVRRERILQVLPGKQLDGKTMVEVLSALNHDYSLATIRTDLMALMERGEISCDDKRKPTIWWRARQK